MSIDRQEEDLYWVTVRAWSEKKSRRLFFGKAYGEEALKSIQAKFKIPPQWVLIDSAYLPKGDHGVYTMCCKNGWIAVKGSPEYEYEHAIQVGKGASRRFIKVRRSYAPLTRGDPESGIKGEGSRFCALIRFSKAQMNQKVQELIDAGLWEEPVRGESAEMEAEYNEQMAGRVRLYDPEKKVVTWMETKNDHARDLANHQVLAAILLGILADPAEEQLSKGEKSQ